MKAARKGTVAAEQWDVRLKELELEGRERHRSAVEVLEAHAKRFDPNALFPAVFAHLTLLSAHQGRNLDSEIANVMLEWFAFHTFPFFGQDTDDTIKADHVFRCADALHELSTAAMQERFSSAGDSTDQERDLRFSLRTEAEIVRGTAYPEQTSAEIKQIQGRFPGHFLKLAGISPSRAVDMLNAIVAAEEQTFRLAMGQASVSAKAYRERWAAIRRKKPIDRSKEEHEFFSFLRDKDGAYSYGLAQALADLSPRLPVAADDLTIDPPVSRNEWDALINLIGLTPETRKQMSQPVDTAKRPLYVLPDGRALLLDNANALDALWEALEDRARRDDAFFTGRYAKAKGDWLEGKIKDRLKNVFPGNSVYQGLTYPDPDKGPGAEAELDLAVRWGPFLVLVEAKAKQFKVASQHGDLRRLRDDIKANVEDAYYQAKRAVAYIDSVEQPTFTEKGTGRELTLVKQDIHRVYLLTVSQHHLAGLANQFALLGPLNLFKENEYPVSMSVSALELVLEACEAPEIFLHYLERRVSLQRTLPQMRADELDLFGAYLATRLREERFKPRVGEGEYYNVALDGYRQEFDVLMRHKRGESDQKADIALKVPPEIHEILGLVRGDPSADARGIAFSLLDLSDAALGHIAAAVRGLRATPVTPGAFFRRYVAKDGDILTFVLASVNQSQADLERNLRTRTAIEKYRSRAEKAIGIGLMLPQPGQPVTTVQWLEGAWCYDEEMEAFVDSEASEPESFAVRGFKLPGRNDPCFCGSGKKFKKCHLRRLGPEPRV